MQVKIQRNSKFREYVFNSTRKFVFNYWKYIYIYSCIDLHWTKKNYFVNLEKRQQQKFETMVRARQFSFDSLCMVSVAYGFLWDNFLFLPKSTQFC